MNIIDVGGIRLAGNNWNLVACNKKAGFNLVSPHGSFEDMNVKIIGKRDVIVEYCTDGNAYFILESLIV